MELSELEIALIGYCLLLNFCIALLSVSKIEKEGISVAVFIVAVFIGGPIVIIMGLLSMFGVGISEG